MIPAASRPSSPSTWLWIGLVALASVGLSRAFACAMPFAALATLAAFTLRRTQGIALVLLVWIANQAIGFGLLHYPCTAATFEWGLAIGVASLAALAASEQVSRTGASVWSALLGLVAAFGAYEFVLFATTWLLPSGRDAFAAGVVLRIFAINAVSLDLLIAAAYAAAALGQPTVRAAASPRGSARVSGGRLSGRLVPTPAPSIERPARPPEAFYQSAGRHPGWGPAAAPALSTAFLQCYTNSRHDASCVIIPVKTRLP